MDKVSSTLNQFMSEMGDTAIRKRVIGMVGKGQASSTPLGIFVISEVAKRLLPEFKKAATKPKQRYHKLDSKLVIAEAIRKIGPEKLLVMTLARTLSQATQTLERNLTYLRNGLADELQLELDIRELRERQRKKAGRTTNSRKADKKRTSAEFRLYRDQCLKRGLSGTDIERRVFLLVAA